VRESEINITPSILDRLIDLDPRTSAEAPKSRVGSLDELKQSVRRDLESLLNARRPVFGIEEDLEEANRSVAVFGLPDFTALGAKNPAEQERISREIENAIEVFEPRFFDVSVNLEPVSNVDKQLVFRIEASLDVEPTPEPIIFDTVLQFGSGQFAVVER
jgi:type VI secretion system protein ImpF